MSRLKSNILMFLVAVLLLCTVGLFGIVYALIHSFTKFSKEEIKGYWADVFYHLAVGIDKIGNVLLQSFLNDTCIIEKNYPFGNVHHTISHVLAVNHLVYSNLTKFGKFIALILEKIDEGHLNKSL